jgi:hypothetical protein
MTISHFKKSLNNGDIVMMKKDSPFDYGIFKGLQAGKTMLWFPNTGITYQVKNDQIDMAKTLQLTKETEHFDLDKFDLTEIEGGIRATKK